MVGIYFFQILGGLRRCPFSFTNANGLYPAQGDDVDFAAFVITMSLQIAYGVAFVSVETPGNTIYASHRATIRVRESTLIISV